MHLTNAKAGCLSKGLWLLLYALHLTQLAPFSLLLYTWAALSGRSIIRISGISFLVQVHKMMDMGAFEITTLIRCCLLSLFLWSFILTFHGIGITCTGRLNPLGAFSLVNHFWRPILPCWNSDFMFTKALHIGHFSLLSFPGRHYLQSAAFPFSSVLVRHFSVSFEIRWGSLFSHHTDSFPNTFKNVFTGTGTPLTVDFLLSADVTMTSLCPLCVQQHPAMDLFHAFMVSQDLWPLAFTLISRVL